MASFSNLQARASLAAQSTALHDAADAGDIASVTDLLRNGADANARAERRFFDEGATALHLASQKGHLEVALALLQAGAELSGRAAHCKKYDNGDNGGVRYNGEWEGDLTPLHLASAYGHVAVVRALVSAGGRTEWIASGNKVEVNLPVDDSGEAFFREHDGGQTPLHLASAYGHAEVVRALAEAGAHVRAWGGACNDTPLHLASASGHVEAMAALLEAGADVDGGDEVGNTALHFVADVDSLELLLSAGANPNLVAESSYGSGTPLGSFCTLIHRLETDEKGMQNATAQVEVLLRHGADTSIPASGEFPEGASPVLSCAAKNGVPGIVSALLSAGLAPNERDKRGWAPLHDAAQGDHVEVVRLLLRAGAEKDAPTARGGWTPLHVACRFTSVACALELLRWGADLAAETGVDSDDDAWSSPLVLDRRRVDVSKGFGKTPAQVIGLKNLAAAAAAAVHGGSADPSLDEDEQMEMFDEGTGERDTGAARRNAIRCALRREAPWRRRRGIILLRSYLDKKIYTAAPLAAPRAAVITAPKRVDRGGNTEIPGYSSDKNHGRVVNVGSARPQSGGSDPRCRGSGHGKKRRARGVNDCGPAAARADVWGGEVGGVLPKALERVVDLAGWEEALFRQIVMCL